MPKHTALAGLAPELTAAEARLVEAALRRRTAAALRLVLVTPNEGHGKTVILMTEDTKDYIFRVDETGVHTVGALPHVEMAAAAAAWGWPDTLPSPDELRADAGGDGTPPLRKWDDRPRLAAYITRTLFTVSPRTLETWPVRSAIVNKRALLSTEETLEHARRLLAEAEKAAVRGGSGSRLTEAA